MPTFVRQLDGSPNAGDNCGPASIAMALRWATAHEIMPTPSAVRAAMKDPTGGTYMSDHRLAWDTYRERNAARWDVKPMRYFAAGDFADLLTALGNGKGATIAIDYSKVPQSLKGDPLFNGLHSVFLAATRERAGMTEVKVFDPLNDGRRPGIPGPMNRSSPNTRCHFLTPTRFRSHRSSKMSMIRLARLSVSSGVFCLLLSSTQPRISFCWFQPPSPLPSFFSDMASLQCVVSASL